MPITDIRLEWRWGKATPWIATLFFLILGSTIVAIAHARGDSFFHAYTICLGYFVAWSIAQSHYFKVNRSEPYGPGLLIYLLIVIAAIATYFGGNILFSALFSGDSTKITFGHFVFIMLGFFFFGLDDFIFGSRLSKWLKKDYLRFVFWLLVIAGIWIFLFAFILKKNDQFWQFFGMFQWPIVCLLAYQLLIKVPGKTLSFGRQLRNFLLLFIIGFATAYFWKIIGISWHQILNLGTFPLLPIIMHGLYFERWPNYQYRSFPTLVKGVSNNEYFVWVRLCLLLVAFVSQNILFFVLMKTGVLGFKADISNAPSLQWCFTVAILPLAHYWFTKFWGFKKLVVGFQKK